MSKIFMTPVDVRQDATSVGGIEYRNAVQSAGTSVDTTQEQLSAQMIATPSLKTGTTASGEQVHPSHLQLPRPCSTQGLRLHQKDGKFTELTHSDLFDVFHQQPMLDTFSEKLEKGRPVLLCQLVRGLEENSQTQRSNCYEAVSLSELFRLNPQGIDPLSGQKAVEAHFFGGLPTLGELGKTDAAGFAAGFLPFYEFGDHTILTDPQFKDAAEFLHVFSYLAQQEEIDPRVYYYLGLLIEAGAGHPLWQDSGVGQKIKAYATCLSKDYYSCEQEFLDAVGKYCCERNRSISVSEEYARQLPAAPASPAHGIAHESWV